MNKKISPYKEWPYRIKSVGPKWHLKIGSEIFIYHNEVDGFMASVTANEAYAHGYRNGMRAGRK